MNTETKHSADWLKNNKFLAFLILVHLFVYLNALILHGNWKYVAINFSVWVALLSIPIAFSKNMIDFYKKEKLIINSWLGFLSVLNFVFISNGVFLFGIVNGLGWAFIFGILILYRNYKDTNKAIKYFGRIFFGFIALSILILFLIRLFVGIPPR